MRKAVLTGTVVASIEIMREAPGRRGVEGSVGGMVGGWGIVCSAVYCSSSGSKSPP